MRISVALLVYTYEDHIIFKLVAPYYRKVDFSEYGEKIIFEYIPCLLRNLIENSFNSKENRIDRIAQCWPDYLLFL